MKLETPLHRVQGLGAAHSGTTHFWRQRVTAAALVPLTIWFGYAVLHLIGAQQVMVLSFFQHPLNMALMGLFMLAATVHMVLGLQVVIEDYVHTEGTKILLLLLARGMGWLIGATALIALFSMR
ncbi:MAG: succinate dehydrogenase, hydrophobic membrane anchor protein [Proteobacteria bacterium]|nr:succinate dehydrogenase, hydrophobic membrane anchor protein [Pseudomonadota bacterium]